MIGDVHDTSLFMHDVLAYLLLAAISVLCVAGPGAGAHLHRVAWFLVTAGSASLALQLAQAWGWIGAGSLDLWYWDRLRGWSENPNQLALLCAMLGLLSLHLAGVAAGTPARIAAIGTAILPIYVGRLSKGDAFSLVLVASRPDLHCAQTANMASLRSTKPHHPLGIRMDCDSRAAPGFCSAIPFGYPLVVEARGLADDLAKGNERDTEKTAQIRLQTWQNAIDRGVESGMLDSGRVRTFRYRL